MPKPSSSKKKAKKATSSRSAKSSKESLKSVSRKAKTKTPPVRKAVVAAGAAVTVQKRTQAVHSKGSQSNRTGGTTSSGTERPRQPKVNPVRTASVKQYEAAVRSLYAHDYEKARVAFEKIIGTFADDREVVERCRIHLRLCEQKIARKPAAPRTLDEHYDLAIALMNEGKYEESMDHLNKALKSNPKCDYVIYALAATQCRTGNFDRAMASLQTAIGLRPENRFLAQRDSDFDVLKQDSRFVSLVFPDPSSASTR
jgi:tetratricopeptide (TPR) repeat protein